MGDSKYPDKGTNICMNENILRKGYHCRRLISCSKSRADQLGKYLNLKEDHGKIILVMIGSRADNALLILLVL